MTAPAITGRPVLGVQVLVVLGGAVPPVRGADKRIAHFSAKSPFTRVRAALLNQNKLARVAARP
jgi:hypothetical protein